MLSENGLSFCLTYEPLYRRSDWWCIPIANRCRELYFGAGLGVALLKLFTSSSPRPLQLDHLLMSHLGIASRDISRCED